MSAITSNHTSNDTSTAVTATDGRPAGATARSAPRRYAAAVLGIGGAVLAAGGAMHPHETSGSLHESLLALLDSPAWLPAHALLLVGTVCTLVGLVLLRWLGVFAARVRPWLTAAVVAWAVAVPELVPHLLAGSEHDALEVGAPAPMVDTHLALSTVTSPLLGLATALLAVSVARAAATWPAWVLAVPGVIGGLAFAAAAPLLVATGDPRWSTLFAAQGLMAIWIVGTAVRVLLAPRETCA